MEKKTFTNENLSAKFKNNFDLVNYAIKLAENMIHTGRETRVKSEVQNRAMLILEEIQEGKDYFDEVFIPTHTTSNEHSLVDVPSDEKNEMRKYKAVLEPI